MKKPTKPQPEEKFCGDCKFFRNNKGRTLKTIGSGYCQIMLDAYEKEKFALKDDEKCGKSVPQIFNYFKCSNNKFKSNE